MSLSAGQARASPTMSGMLVPQLPVERQISDESRSQVPTRAIRVQSLLPSIIPGRILNEVWDLLQWHPNLKK